MYFNSEKHLNMHINGNTAHNKVDEDESETTFVEEVERSNDSIANDFNNSDDDHNQQPEYISSTRRTLNKVNEIQQSTGNNKLAGVHTLSNELMRGAVTSSRSPLSETRDELIEVEDESKRHILDNLATKTIIFTICNPGK
jgi:formylmethanofuran dehydrogenase subunit E-like metal-binding protein